MSKDGEQPRPWEMDDEAMAIIVRHRPDLQGKTLEEAKAILRTKHPGKKAARNRQQAER